MIKKLLNGIVGQWRVLFALLVVFMLTGCGGGYGGSKQGAGAVTGGGAHYTFAVGDIVVVSFSGVQPDYLPPQHDERIKEDGTITMPYVGSIVAAGKTPGNLQKELQDKFLNYIKNIVVTVKDLDHYYYVTGEVRGPGPKQYLGETDIITAISAAGDFTEFAKKKRIRLIRNGRTQIINYDKAVTDPTANVKIFPEDKIIVPRRFW